jgi:hypothetical protein
MAIKFCSGSPACSVCGASHREGEVQNCPSPLRDFKYAGSGQPSPRPSPRGLGDFIESGLTYLGITQERWVEWKRSHGLPPTCNCVDRKEWLNNFGREFGGAAATAMRLLVVWFKKGKPIDS